jgi:hypothetical protein
MSGHILIARGDMTVETRKLLNDLAAANKLHGAAPDVEIEGDRTIIVMDQHQEDVIPEFERIGFVRQGDEDSF